MRNQNEKLKKELFELAQQMDEHVKQDKISQEDNDFPSDFQAKQKSLASYQKIITENRIIIENLKR